MSQEPLFDFARLSIESNIAELSILILPEGILQKKARKAQSFVKQISQFEA